LQAGSHEVMKLHDQYLKGVKPSVKYPNFAVQTNDASGGRRRSGRRPKHGLHDEIKAGLIRRTTATASRGRARAGVWTTRRAQEQTALLSGSAAA